MLTRADKQEIKGLIKTAILEAQFDALDRRAERVAVHGPTAQQARAEILTTQFVPRPLQPGDQLFGPVSYEPERSAADIAHERVRREAEAEATADAAQLAAYRQCVLVADEDPAEVESRSIWDRAVQRLYGA